MMRRSRLFTVLASVALLMLAVLSLSVSASSSSSSVGLSLEAAKLSVSSIDGSSRISESFTLKRGTSLSEPLAVESDEVLRLAFTLKDAQGEKLSNDALPHQIVVSMTDVDDPTIAHTSIVSVKRSTGKASWNQRFDRLPANLVRGGQSGRLAIQLLIGSFGSAAPINIPLVTVQLPSSVLVAGSATHADAVQSQRVRRETQQGFHRHPDRHHTFAVPAADQMPPKLISLLAAAATFVVPWIVLLALWSRTLSSLNVKSFSPSVSPFFGSLLALELLAYLYWHGLGLTLFKMFPWLLVLSAVTVFTGRTALSELRRIRLGKTSA